MGHFDFNTARRRVHPGRIGSAPILAAAEEETAVAIRADRHRSEPELVVDSVDEAREIHR